MKNKAVLKDNRTSGTELFQTGSYINLVKNPLKFANSDKLRKIQNRNRKRK